LVAERSRSSRRVQITDYSFLPTFFAFSSKTNNPATKNGNIGILYLTKAPKLAVANPTPNPKIITKLNLI
jgi:hypothetical protein